MNDLISRKAAIDALDRIGSLDTEADKKYARSVFEALPSAQPERRGHWIKKNGMYECSECGVCFHHWSPYCRDCGAKMDEWEGLVNETD